MLSCGARADVSGQIDLEPLRREALNAERQPRVLWAGPHVMTNPADPIPPSRERARVQDLHLRLVEGAVHGLAFRLHPHAIQIAADPRLVIPPQSLRAVDVLPLELIEEHAVVPHAVVHGVAVGLGERRLAVGVRDRRHGYRILGGSADWQRQCDDREQDANHSSTRTSRNMPASM